MSYYDATIYLQFGVNDMNKKKSGEKAYASKIKKTFTIERKYSES